MEEINKAYATFEERDHIASLGGGVDKIEKQHESGKMTARERIEMLLDKGTFVELDKLMVHRCTNYGMDKNKIPGDGIVSGYGKVDGRQVFVYAYDFTVYGGSLSASNAKKIVKVQQLALKNGAPIIALNDSGGARIQEGIESLSGYAISFLNQNFFNAAIRSHFVVALHLHCFDNDDSISRFHFLTDYNRYFHYLARHRRNDTVILFLFPFLAHP